MALALLCEHPKMPLLRNYTVTDKMAHELQYRNDQRRIADLMHENRLLRMKLVTLTWMLIVSVGIFVTAMIVNVSK